MTVMYWLGAAAIFVVIEIITMGLTTIWFAGGALVGAVMAAFSPAIMESDYRICDCVSNSSYSDKTVGIEVP